MNHQRIAMHFADALSRERALTSRESDMLLLLSNAAKSRNGWSGDDDRMMQLLRRKNTISRTAEVMGRTFHSVASRERQLRRREKSGGIPQA